MCVGNGRNQGDVVEGAGDLATVINARSHPPISTLPKHSPFLRSAPYAGNQGVYSEARLPDCPSLPQHTVCSACLHGTPACCIVLQYNNILFSVLS